MGHPERGRFIQDGFYDGYKVHAFEHMADDNKVVVMPLDFDAADKAAYRSSVVLLPDRPPADWHEVEVFRASGEVVCHICNQPYWRHYQVAKKEVPALVRVCDGRLLKL